jgi:CubicO group peptidase (beta-lactamase class C family)
VERPVWSLLTGYVILGILIRKITGKYYGDFLEERVRTAAHDNGGSYFRG